MAASAPVSDSSHWMGDRNSSEALVNTQSIEVGMSGMSLLTSLSDGGERERKGTTFSTISTSPPYDHEDVNHQHLPPSVHSSFRGSAPPSPSNNPRTQSRPPGLLGGPMPSPIAHRGNSKNTATTSPSLTLTPNSSVDGQSEYYSIGRSPYNNDPPVLPFLQAEHRRTHTGGSYGTLDFIDDNNDGLLGLGALRERALSSPGMISNSPPLSRGHFAAHQPTEPPERPRGRDRPPRSHPYEGYGSYQGDRNFAGFTSHFSSSPGRNDTSNMSLDSNDQRSFGAIARPELRQAAAEFDPGRVRSSSFDNYQQPPYGFQQQQQQQQGGVSEQFTHKFGSLPTLSAHLQQQRVPDNYTSNVPKPRHVRSISQPVPTGFASQQLPPGVDMRFYGNSIPSNRHSFSMSGSTGFKEGSSVPRSASMSHSSTLQNSYDNPRYSQKGSAVPNLGAYQQQSGYSNMQRRDPLDYVNSGSQSSGSGVVSPDEIRSFCVPSMISPGQSPLQTHYGSHSRQPSDHAGNMLSSSPLSMGSGIMRGSGQGSIHVHHSSDDDFAHPLVGEHIEVPADHDDHDSHGSYMMSRGSHPLLRPPSHVHALSMDQISTQHVHSLSMDQIPTQYMDAPHHLPTAGAALPMPKVVYTVKFKRTQRSFVLGPRINRDLKIGTYVKVEADRGEDLGIVIGKSAVDKFGFPSRASFTAGMGPSPAVLTGGAPSADLKRIIRLATHDEVSLLSMKRDEEEELLKICRSKVRQRGLPMHVVDAEYQFDRHKLTFFFEAEGRVDFRELVRDLFSMYKTRIWMQQLDKNTSTSSPAIMSPHAASLLQMDYGTPIIAPVSEFADSIVMNGLSGGDVRTH